MPQSRLEQDPFDDDPDIEIQESSAHVGHDPLSLFSGLLPSGQRDQRIRDMIFGGKLILCVSYILVIESGECDRVSDFGDGVCYSSLLRGK